MKVRIGATGKQTRLDSEFAHEYRDALVEGKRLWVVYGGVRCKEFFLHKKSSSLSSILSPLENRAKPAGERLVRQQI
jgi:hypothetical protein